MEFLMTYGWAILIMLVVIAVLFFLGIFSASTAVPKSCVLPAGFSCYDYDMDSSGFIYLDIGQATGRTVTITGIGCAASSPNVTLNPNVVIESGSHGLVTVGGTSCSGGDGSGFKGTLLIQYTSGGSLATRSITGAFSAPLQGNSSAWVPSQWGSGQFGFRRKVLVTTGISSDLADFPAFFVLDTQSLISAGKMNSSCRDLRLTDSLMSSALDYEIEANTCNTSNTVVWVRMPLTKANLSNVVYAFYGNSSAADGQNKPGVWRNGFSFVFHLSDMSDSKGVKNLDNYGGVPDTGMRGIANTAYYYGGVTNYSSVNGDPVLPSIHGPSTVSLWAKPASTSGNKRIFSDWCMEWGVLQSGATVYGIAYVTTATAPFAAGSWYHVAVSHAHPYPNYANTTVRLLVNGAAAAQTIWTYSTQNGYTDAPFSIGGDGCYSGTYNFNGTIDEVRISRIARSDDWLIAEYRQTY
ncbi:Concanavalin A-like lectin/glucanases superfamily protein [uncultured archaeon]|nr:Concanavalin A-like lectin/glucanases superfamily protein [uncultured archaeon]